MHQNNFNLLRLLFAVFVLATHSHTLSNGSLEDWLTQHTYHQISFSFIGLSGFFTISGYLVFQSLERSSNLIDYFKRRVLRIFPGLFVVLALTVLLGSLVYEGSFSSYLSNPSTWTYLPRNFFMVKPQDSIAGIFSTNPYGRPVINGSLWSLLYECTFYVALAGLFFVKKRTQLILTLFTLSVLIVARLFFQHQLGTYNYILSTLLVLEFCPFFVFGSLLALAKIETVKYPSLILLALTAALILVTYLRGFDSAKFFILPPIVILLGLRNFSTVNQLLTKLGDISYGVYIYAFPVQQTLMHFFKFNAVELMTSSIIISCILGYCSWHCVEKYALRLK